MFRLQRLRAHAQPGYANDCFDLVLDLYGADVEYSADSLEDIYTTLGKVGSASAAGGGTTGLGVGRVAGGSTGPAGATRADQGRLSTTTTVGVNADGAFTIKQASEISAIGFGD